MEVFNILDPSVGINRHIILEASAGCGKTFAIEHLIIRRILEPTPGGQSISLKDIAVVTFTRAATRELKTRIRGCLEKSIEFLQNPHNTHPLPYLQVILEQGEEAMRMARWKLQEANAQFEECSILTIHGFCQKMLAEFFLSHHFSLDGEKWFSKAELIRLIQDFLRTHVDEEEFSIAQLYNVMNTHNHDIDALIGCIEKTLSKAGTDPHKIQQRINVQLLKQLLLDRIHELGSKHGWTRERVLNNLYELARSHKKCCDRKGQVLSNLQRQFEAFAECIDGNRDFETIENLIISPLFFSQVFKEPKAKSKKQEHDFDPNFLEICKAQVEPFIHLLASERVIFEKLTTACSKLISKVILEKGAFLPDLLLEQMQKATGLAGFCTFVRDRFRCVLIDEFQDTDPVQWDIFDSLFLKDNVWAGYICLIGDPKQSIYGFRNADIYTYIQAKQRLGEGAVSRLDTNFRSSPSLVAGINQLFCNPYVKTLFSLPKIHNHLDCFKVQPNSHVQDFHFKDGKKALHCLILEDSSSANKKWPSCEVEERILFPAIARELLSLKEQGIPFSRCAVLVRDRYQLDRLKLFLEDSKIPAAAARGASLDDCEALAMLKRMIKAVKSWSDRSAVLGFLISSPIYLSYQECLALREDTKESLEEWSTIAHQLQRLRRSFEQSGFAQLFQDWLKSTWLGDSQTIKEKIVGRVHGDEVYSDLEQVFETVIKYQSRWNGSLDACDRFLDRLHEECSDEELQLSSRFDPNEEAVPLLTMHRSKGLQYDVVFALGVINRSPKPEDTSYLKWQALAMGSPLEESEYDLESEAEKLRQFYVAATRARLRLYLPILVDSTDKVIPFGMASPMELYLAHIAASMKDPTANSMCSDFQCLYSLLNSSMQRLALNAFLQETAIISSSVEEPFNFYGVEPSLKLKSEIICPQVVIPPCINRRFESFSSLKSKSGTLIHFQQDDVEEEWHLLESRQDPSSTIKKPNASEIPLGAETGIILHELLALMTEDPLRCRMNRYELEEWLEFYLRNTSLKGWHEQVACLLHTTFHCTLASPYGDFRLVDVDWTLSFREVEFIYPKELRSGDSDCIELFYKGIIDLAFMANGAYWIIDWKSNWLGSTLHDYTQDRLKDAVQQHRYDLQASIYQEAFIRYLSLFNSSKQQIPFVGTYYLFLRGLSLNERDQSGVYFIPGQCSNLMKDAASLKL